MSDQQSPSNLDEAIDRAVRRIVEVAPPPGLEGRVRARLAAPVRRELPFSMGWAAAAAMLTLVLAAGVLLREQRDAAPDTPAVLSSRTPGEPAQEAAQVGGPGAGQPAPSGRQMASPIDGRQQAGAAATAPPPLETRARKADRLDEREMAVTAAAEPGAAAAVNSAPAESSPSTATREPAPLQMTAQAFVAPPASVPSSAAMSAPASVAAPTGTSAVADTAAAARPSATATASRLASRSRAAVAATPVMGTALDANEAAPATGGAANAAAKGSADRLEISPLKLPPLRLAPLTIAPIPDTDRQP